MPVFPSVCLVSGVRGVTVFLGWVGVVCVDFWLFVGGGGVKPCGAGVGVHRRRYTNAHTSNTKKVTETGGRK